MVDKLFAQSGKSNCKIDNDKILLDISSVAMAKYIKPLPRNVEKPPTTDVALLITPPLSLPTKNVAAYLAGHSKSFLLMSVESILTKCYCISYPQSMMNCLHMSSSEIKLTKKLAA